MAFDFASLVTDRTQADVDLGTAKGCYSAQDLNRVGAAVAELTERLWAVGGNPHTAPRLDWREEEWPTPSTAQRYLLDLREMRRQLNMPPGVPEVPESLEQLTYAKANDIESICGHIDRLIDLLERIYPRSGVYASGGAWYLPDQSHDWLPLPEPVRGQNPVYTGGVLHPSFAGTEHCTVEGSGVDAGNYSTSIKPLEGYKWEDCSTAAKTFPWAVEKAPGVIRLPETVIMDKEHWQLTLPLEYTGDGQLTVSKDNDNLTMVVVGNQIRLQSGVIGETQITVRATEGRNYLAAGPAVCTVRITDLVRYEPVSGSFHSGSVLHLPDKYR